MRQLRQLLPSAEALRANRWLRWLGPALHHPKLWHFSRRGVALGMALGCFFGLLVPLAQIPLSAAAAVALRANIPVAVASTLVTNPVTFGPIYYAAWRVGSAILGEPAEAEPPMPTAVEQDDDASWWDTVSAKIRGVGKPLLLGLVITATAVGIATYVLVSAVWRVSVLWRRHRRRH
jgi:uncharacterized protein (DUF2062 family)